MFAWKYGKLNVGVHQLACLLMDCSVLYTLCSVDNGHWKCMPLIKNSKRACTSLMFSLRDKN